MPNIKEIALNVADSLRNKIDGISHMQSNQGLVAFAEALVAELAKQNEPCAFLHEWIEYHPFGDTFAGEPCTTITNDEKPFDSSDTVSPLFTIPPTAEQLTARVRELEWKNVRLKAESRDACLGLNDYYGRKLAAEQLNNKLLREALTTCVCAMQDYQAGIGITEMFDKGERLGRKALSLPAPTEALDKYVEEKVKEYN